MEIAVIGGGAAGMFAAIQAAGRGAHVSLYEGGSTPGRKLLSTGNGRCNFTNYHMTGEAFRSEAPELVMPVIRAFDQNAVISEFSRIGILAHDREGYVYPASDQASSLRDALLTEMSRLRVSLHNNSRVVDIQVNADEEGGNSFTLLMDSGYEAYADTLILACGGRSMPVSGSDGSGFILAKKLGHKVIRPLPALTYLQCRDFPASLHGVRVRGTVRLTDGSGKPLDNGMEAEGELQFTRNGISGIPAFQISRYAAILHQKKQTVYGECDVDPCRGREEAFPRVLARMARQNPELRLEQVMKGMLPEKLAEEILRLAAEKCPEVNTAVHICEITETATEALTDTLSHLQYRITGTGSFEQSQVTRGGVDLREINTDTMESRLVQGLFFAGEMVDVDAICGGYNLQWAWSSGFAAGRSACRRSIEIGSYAMVPYWGDKESLLAQYKNSDPGDPADGGTDIKGRSNPRKSGSQPSDTGSGNKRKPEQGKPQPDQSKSRSKASPQQRKPQQRKPQQKTAPSPDRRHPGRDNGKKNNVKQ